jgi:ParB-like chromosome segregation protein Spo0J
LNYHENKMKPMKQPTKQVEELPTADLIPYARNAKKHDDAQIAKIAGSIREFGFNNPVLIDGKNGIIAGHGRVMAAQKLGLEQVPCIRLDHLSETQKQAYILADNRLAEIGGGWDMEALKIELEELGRDEDWMDFDEILSEDEIQEKEDKASEMIFEQSVQLKPAKEFLAIILEAEEVEEAKELLRLKQVRRGGYKKGSAFDSVGWEKCIKWERVKNVISGSK